MYSDMNPDWQAELDSKRMEQKPKKGGEWGFFYVDGGFGGLFLLRLSMT